MKTYRVGFASLVHDHVWGELRAWQALPNVELVAAGDVNDNLRARFLERVPGATMYKSWREMLAGESHLDVVQIASENSFHAEIVSVAAQRGCHIIVEKPMASTLEGATQMYDDAKRTGITLLVNWPNAWNPAWQEFERRVLRGDIGEIRYLKYRSAHNGPREIGCDPHFVEWLYDEQKNGAGAFMDYCCYGAVLCARHLGMPKSVTGQRAVLAKNYPLPDDNAVITMLFDHAVGVAEASWTQPTGYLGTNPEAYGSDGAIGIMDGKIHLLKPGKPAEILDVPAPVAPRRSGPEYLLHCIETGELPYGYCAPDVSLIAQEILAAGLRAADTGKTQAFGGA